MISNKKHQIMSLVLYAMPIMFFVVCYYLMTVTGEDIFQGAETKSGYLAKALDAFRYNSRISDMYAWSIIQCFDYQFSFGIDTIFRAIDVLLATGIIYMISYISLGRKLKLSLWDAVVFCLVFCAMIFSKTCESLYLAFSHIHNYLIIGFFSMLFFLPFAKYTLGMTICNKTLFKWGCFVSGFLFGFSSNITPIAFLITTFIIFCAYIAYMYKSQMQPDYKKAAFSWQAISIYGILTACLLMYTLGSGVSAYLGDSYAQLTGYISFKQILSQPTTYIPQIINHIYVNFKDMLPCLLLMTMATGYEFVIYKKHHDNENAEKGPAIFTACCLVFVIVHIIIMSQLKLSMTLRLIMPAYFVCIACLGYVGIRIAKEIKCTNAMAAIVCTCLLVVSSTAIYDMGKSKYQYTCQIKSLIDYIDNTDNSIVYIPYSQNNYTPSKIFNFNQYNFIHDWVIAEKTIHGKQIIFDYTK